MIDFIVGLLFLCVFAFIMILITPFLIPLLIITGIIALISLLVDVIR
jgi:hypothetical protein